LPEVPGSGSNPLEHPQLYDPIVFMQRAVT
jgi:hypothetical protein